MFLKIRRWLRTRVHRVRRLFAALGADAIGEGVQSGRGDADHRHHPRAA